MQLINTVNGMRAFSRQAHDDVRTVGLVPTMGSLHEGHLGLIRRSKSQCDATIVSIFVNPAQFGPHEDLARYPRNLKKDIDLLHPFNVDAVFAPETREVYPEGFATSVDPGGIANVLEGAARPGHFRGVATVLVKFFNIVDPDLAFFGQKDLQQTVVVRQIVNDLNMRVRLVICPIVREADGVAASSRNAYLSPGERKSALALWRSLQRAKELVWAGEESPDRVIAGMQSVLAAEPGIRVDEIALVDPRTLETVKRAVAGCVILVAAHVGATRLIDNAFLGHPDSTEEQLLEAAQGGVGAATAIAGPIHAPGFEAGSLKRQIESCRDCAAITSVVMPPREFLAKYLKMYYPDLATVRVLVIGRDAPWNGEHYIYRNPGIKDQFTERLYNLVGASGFADFKTRFAMTDALRCHGIVTPLPERALANCARHLPGEIRLFPNLQAIVVLGDDAYLQFQRSILGRGKFTPFSELLAEKGWASEEVTLSAYPNRALRVIYCYHLAGGYRSSPSIAPLLP
ncbi:MAG: pantoate--beta-alanine ligase [Acidobacteriota bacterium]|nr:pantoate--beta-alanine ligase [Acidobacteriota bacterium]